MHPHSSFQVYEDFLIPPPTPNMPSSSLPPRPTRPHPSLPHAQHVLIPPCPTPNALTLLTPPRIHVQTPSLPSLMFIPTIMPHLRWCGGRVRVRRPYHNIAFRRH
ncbi:hypothetical protein E2C01_024092 [Portunus trituberculatus]|uniref:Uncharacterized protein n=1 Tax=Portunus trituberculatus TaxID=210409 RepID=A0A5B7ECY0_PORTR|nr:hypothetical protein [Portunus trituberculatus]